MSKHSDTTRTRKRRDDQTRYLSQAVQLEEAVNPQIIRVTMTMASLAVLVFIVWAGFTHVHEVARTSGEVVPRGFQQTVQHLEGGIVQSINVHEGDVVEKGQVLVILNDGSIKEDLERVAGKQLSLQLHAERLRAFVEGRRPNLEQFGLADKKMILDQTAFFDDMLSARIKEERVIQDQIAQKRQAAQSLRGDLETARANQEIINELHQRRLQLSKKGFGSEMKLLEERRRLNNISGEIKRLQNQILVAQSEIAEFEDRAHSLTARHRDEVNDKLNQVLADNAQNTEIIDKLEERISRLSIRAPTRGLIKGLTVNTVGAVVQPAQTIMEIVPLGTELEVQANISPQDIGHLAIGQPVQVKFSTYDFSRYGIVTGQLDHLSATTFVGEKGERYYRGRISLAKNYVGDDRRNLILPGMTVMADVITGNKTILQYLLKPIHVSLKTAFKER